MLLYMQNKSNNIYKYCANAKCEKVQVQKDTFILNSTGNNTKISRAMRYSQIIRKHSN